MVTGEVEAPNKDKGWGTLDSSWLDLKEENEGKTFHVNVITEEVKCYVETVPPVTQLMKISHLKEEMRTKVKELVMPHVQQGAVIINFLKFSMAFHQFVVILCPLQMIKCC